jgi:hypothetical protein
VQEFTNIHWVEDQDLLEQFVLGRLESPDTSALEKHLRECAQCREVVDRERELVAGIRLAGRDALKRRMSQKLRQREARTQVWYRVAGIAAGIVLLVTIGIYNRWFDGTETPKETSDRTDQRGKLAAPAPSVAPQGELSNQEKPRGEVESRTPEQATQAAQGLGAGASKSGGVESGRLAEAKVEKPKDFTSVDALRDEEHREKKDRLAASTVGTSVATTWVEGTVISEEDYNRPAAEERVAKALDERSTMRKGKQENNLAGKPAMVEGAHNTSQNYVVTQRLLSDLPRSQQLQRQRANSIQALLQKDPSGTQLTVFLDSLLTKKEFDRSEVQTIGEDSIIVNLGNRRVGYKLPPEWTGQMQQSKRAK